MNTKAKATPLAIGVNSAVRMLDWGSYFQMTKPTISLLVVVTVVPSLFMASQGLPSLGIACATLIGTFLASGSASVFNHLVDSDIDSSMKRTRARPIPSGRVSTYKALLFGLCLGAVSLAILYTFASPLAAWIALGANGFYVVIYTMILKRRTVQNIVIGGAAGAVGPLIGWAAVTGRLEWPAWVLFLLIFLWTPPHFWALAIKYRDDYEKVGVPMLPSVKGVAVTRTQILVYSLLLLPTVFSLYTFNRAGWLFAAVAGALTLYFIWLAYRLYRTQDDARAMPLFFFSCFYLFGVFGILTFDRLIDFGRLGG